MVPYEQLSPGDGLRISDGNDQVDGRSGRLLDSPRMASSMLRVGAGMSR